MSKRLPRRDRGGVRTHDVPPVWRNAAPYVLLQRIWQGAATVESGYNVLGNAMEETSCR